jgi:hypothetical protein
MEKIEIIEIIEEIIKTYINISHGYLMSTERGQVIDFINELKNTEINNKEQDNDKM